ncbi:serine/threonine-protein kinase [Actinomadura madurae]|uniref:serine/threonine-protein kinase n=1 Tax=Actinomadura madurae TaxID=1993 RepID=UPI0020D25A9C|nr:serine/threonine-protein kinase [Actinomadura madurae]MCP9985045.1 protein kinase [Actinomadura madurae]
MEHPTAAGRYRIDRLLGSGGFASVWLGHDPELDSPVAIKILAEHWTLRTDVRDRFVQEARLLRRADSHRLVQVFDIGELPDGRPYFVMTHADRGTLAERLAGGPLPPDEALRTAREISLGVQELHDLGVVHRDLKPSNVLLRSAPGGGERLMISDLGIARTEDHLSSLTLPAGSPGYMAPEQTQVDGAPDRRADIYGLGALTHHLLTGEPPAVPARPAGDTRPAIPPAVSAAVLRALEPDRERRWASAAEFGEALASAAGDVGTDPLPESPPVGAGRPGPAAEDADRGGGRGPRRRARGHRRRLGAGGRGRRRLRGRGPARAVAAPGIGRPGPVPGSDRPGRDVVRDARPEPGADRGDAEGGERLRPGPGGPGEGRVRHRALDAPRAGVLAAGRARQTGAEAGADHAGAVDPGDGPVPVLLGQGPQGRAGRSGAEPRRHLPQLVEDRREGGRRPGPVQAVHREGAPVHGGLPAPLSRAWRRRGQPAP